MNKVKFYLVIAVLMGVGFLFITLLNMFFIFVLGEVNVPLLNLTPMLLVILLLVWWLAFLFMMVYSDKELTLGYTDLYIDNDMPKEIRRIIRKLKRVE